jgi:hypothetical protein
MLNIKVVEIDLKIIRTVTVSVTTHTPCWYYFTYSKVSFKLSLRTSVHDHESILYNNFSLKKLQFVFNSFTVCNLNLNHTTIIIEEIQRQGI